MMGLDTSGPTVSAAIDAEIIKIMISKGDKPKLWCVKDDYYFCAYTKHQAMQCARDEWGMKPEHLDAPTIKDVSELTDEALDYLMIEDEVDPDCVRTFRVQLEREIAAGTPVPYMFTMRE